MTTKEKIIERYNKEFKNNGEFEILSEFPKFVDYDKIYFTCCNSINGFSKYDVEFLIKNFFQDKSFEPYLCVFKFKKEDDIWAMGNDSQWWKFRCKNSIFFDSMVYFNYKNPDSAFIIYYTENIFSKIPLNEFEKIKISTTLLKKLILKRYCRLDKEDFPAAKKIYEEGKVDFLYLFGKERIPVPNSAQLYELITNEHFKTKNKQYQQSEKSVLYGNISAVFNYHYSLIDEKIISYFYNNMTKNAANKYSFEGAFSIDNILPYFKKLAKKDKEIYKKYPDELKLLIEIK